MTKFDIKRNVGVHQASFKLLSVDRKVLVVLVPLHLSATFDIVGRVILIQRLELSGLTLVWMDPIVHDLAALSTFG